jgi:hypothetical protein
MHQPYANQITEALQSVSYPVTLTNIAKMTGLTKAQIIVSMPDNVVRQVRDCDVVYRLK